MTCSSAPAVLPKWEQIQENEEEMEVFTFIEERIIGGNYHDWSYNSQLIIKDSGFVDVTSLESDLKSSGDKMVCN